MQRFRHIVLLVFLLSNFAFLTPSAALAQGGEYYIVIDKSQQRLYLAQGDPKAPESSDVIKDFPVTTGALWTQKGLETPSGVFTVISKSNSPVQGGYDFTDTGDVTLTPYFMRLNVPGREGIGIHTYTGRTLDIWRFGEPGGETTHGCIAGPPEHIIDLYKNYVQPGKTQVWIVDHLSEAFKDLPAPKAPTTTVVNGKSWQVMQSPSKKQLYAVDMVRPDLGWVVAGDAGFDGDKYIWNTDIYRWDGKQWKLEAHVPYWLHGLDMLSANEGWAVGQNFMGGLQYKNGKWTKVPQLHKETDEVYVSDVEAVSADNVWTAGGGGEIWHWNGSRFEWHYAPEINKTIRAISMLDDSFGWMVGGGWDTTTKETVPMIGMFDGETWVQVESPVNELFYGADVVSRNDAWAVGSSGTIIRWNGKQWSSVKSPTKARLSDVEMISATDGWAVGDEKGVALHWDGKRWERVKLPVEEKFYELSVLEDGSAMAVGSNGAMIQLRPVDQQPAKGSEEQPNDRGASGQQAGTTPTVQPSPTVHEPQAEATPSATQAAAPVTTEVATPTEVVSPTATPGSSQASSDEPPAITKRPTFTPLTPNPNGETFGLGAEPAIMGIGAIVGIAALVGLLLFRR